MPDLRIPVNGGRVNSRDPSLLDPGELSVAQDAEYRLFNPAIWKVRGRAEFNSSAEANALRGGAFLDFDDATLNLFVVMRGTAYRKAAAAETGSFSDLGGFDASNYALAGTATTLDATHYGNQHVLMNGVDRNRVVRSTGDQMFHSMLAAGMAPDVTLNGITTGFTLSSGATMLYWVEERVKVNGVVIKRSPSALATVRTITGTGVLIKPRINQPVLANPDTTHWAVFASATSGAFPVGAEIAEEAIAIAFIDDTRTGTDPGLPGGTAYETLTAIIGGTTFVIPKNGAAPIGSTSDIFEDSLLMNDTSDKGNVLFSVDDNIHAVPTFNKFRIGDTKRRDEVIAIRSLDNVACIIGRHGIYRLNTLPRPDDTTFSPERVKAKTHFAPGGVSPMAAEIFSFGQGLRLAYVSPYGVHVTDTSDWNEITDDMDFENEVNVSALGTAVLINNPRMFRLELFYPSPGSTRPDRCAFLHYHPSHSKAAEDSIRAKVTWPIHRDANAAFVARLSGQDIVFSCNENGKVYRHDTGNTEPVIAGGIRFIVETGEHFPADFGNETRLLDFLVHHQAGAANQVGDAYFIERNAGQDDHEVRTAAMSLSRREATPTETQGLAESFIFGFSNTDSLGPIAIDYFVAQFETSGQSKEP